MRTTLGIVFALVVLVVGVVVIVRDPESWKEPKGAPVSAKWRAPAPVTAKEPQAVRHARQAAPEQVPARHAKLDEGRRPRDSDAVYTMRQEMKAQIVAWEDRQHLTDDQRQAAHDVLADMAEEYRASERAWDAERIGHPHDPFVSEGAMRADAATDLAPDLYARLADAVGQNAADDFARYNGAFVEFILRYDVVSR